MMAPGLTSFADLQYELLFPIRAFQACQRPRPGGNRFTTWYGKGPVYQQSGPATKFSHWI